MTEVTQQQQHSWEFSENDLVNMSCVCACLVVSDSVTPWTAAQQAPLSMGFSRQERWSGVPCPPPGGGPGPGIAPLSPASPALEGRAFYH